MKINKTAATILIVVSVLVVVFYIVLNINYRIPETAITSSSVSIVENVSSTSTKVADLKHLEFQTNINFSFKNYSGIDFKILKVNKLYDPVDNYNNFARGIANPALVTIDLEITNNSDKKLDANYFQIIYNNSSTTQSLIAPYYIHTSYESGPMSRIVVSPTFIVPNNQLELSLVTGIYPPIIYDTVEDLLSKSTDAFIIDFRQMKVWHPEG